MGYQTKYTLCYTLPTEEEYSKITNFIQACKEYNIDIPEDMKIVADRYITDSNKLEAELNQVLCDEDFTEYGPLINFINGNNEPIKWYDHDDKILELSAMFPTVLFTLYGDGEDASDHWVTYYKDEKKHRTYARIIYDEFDESKLK